MSQKKPGKGDPGEINSCVFFYFILFHGFSHHRMTKSLISHDSINFLRNRGEKPVVVPGPFHFSVSEVSLKTRFSILFAPG